VIRDGDLDCNKDRIMLGLSALGLFHTGLGLIALGYAAATLARYRFITPHTHFGRVYLWMTFVTAATGLGIYAHGHFGNPHVLSLMTLAALALGILASYSSSFGRSSVYVQAFAFSSTIFFHLIPGVTETATRLPLGAPWLASADAPELKIFAGVLLLGLLVGLGFQFRWLHVARRSGVTLDAQRLSIA
jgi:uncharacterized membrane protein